MQEYTVATEPSSSTSARLMHGQDGTSDDFDRQGHNGDEQDEEDIISTTTSDSDADLLP